jgi:hypothetical protein
VTKKAKNKPRKKTNLQSIPDNYGNVTDLANRLGITKGRVSQLHKKGAFGDTFTRLNNRRYIIDIEAAVENVKKYSDPVARGIKNKISRLNPPDPPPEQRADDGGLKADDRRLRAEKAKTIELTGMSFSTARTLKEQYNAEMKKLDYEERAGKLLRDEDVRKGAFEMYRKTRDSLLNIIDRISAQLTAEKKEANVRIILENEIRNALTHIRSEYDD